MFQQILPSLNLSAPLLIKPVGNFAADIAPVTLHRHLFQTLPLSMSFIMAQFTYALIILSLCVRVCVF